MGSYTTVKHYPYLIIYPSFVFLVSSDAAIISVVHIGEISDVVISCIFVNKLIKFGGIEVGVLDGGKDLIETSSSFREHHTPIPLFLEDFQIYAAECIKEKLKDKTILKTWFL